MNLFRIRCRRLSARSPAAARVGLVCMRLAYFSRRVADETSVIELKPQTQYLPGQEEEMETKVYQISFGQIYLSKTMMTEADGETATLFPKEARLRNLTYAPTSKSPSLSPP